MEHTQEITVVERAMREFNVWTEFKKEGIRDNGTTKRFYEHLKHSTSPAGVFIFCKTDKGAAFWWDIQYRFHKLPYTSLSLAS